MRLSILAVLLAAEVCAANVAMATEARFVVYEKGLETGHLYSKRPFLDEYRISKRDRFTRHWSEFVTQSVNGPSDVQRELPGSLKLVVQLGRQFSTLDWKNSGIVRLSEGSGPFFEFSRGPSVHSIVRGRQIKGYWWRQVDGGAFRHGVPPIDLIIGDRDQLLGAFDPSDDDALIKTGYEAIIPTMHLWNAKNVSLPRYGIRKLPRVLVRMSDGVRLATDIYLPYPASAGERFPVLLSRTPYDARVLLDSAWQYVARGYAVVLQDVRGRYGSEGEFWPDRTELKDGDETLTWIAKQRWSNAEVGMMGGSYRGSTQWEAAYRGNPSLKAIIPVVSKGTPHGDMPYIGGALDVGAVEWTSRMDGREERGLDWAKFLGVRPFRDIGKLVLGRNSPLWNEIADHQLYDEYWKVCDWLRHEQNIDVPALQISGWYDDDHPGTLANWAMMARNQRSNQQMILGPWRHGINRDREINGVSFGPDAVRADLSFLMQQWYDHFLKHLPNGVETRPPVEYFSVGDNKWRSATAWPPRESTMQSWYLHGGGGAASLKDGKLSTVAPKDEPFDPYRYDPKDPTPSLIDVAYNEQSLPDNYSRIESRPDVAVFESEVLSSAVRIAGPIKAILYSASSATDTDWIVRLSDVDPAGNAFRLVEGVIRARFRNTFEREELLTPGKVERYEIAMRSHANSFLPGHRIRVSVSSAAAGYIFPNSNTGKDEATIVQTQVADQSIYHDARFPSQLLLPIMR